MNLDEIDCSTILVLKIKTKICSNEVMKETGHPKKQTKTKTKN